MGFLTKWEEVVNLLSVEDQIYLEQHSRKVHFDCKEMLFKQGSFAVNCYIIQKGFCKLTYSNGVKKRIVKVIKPGDIVGKDYEHLEYYPYTLHTLTKAQAIVIPMSILLELCEKNKDVQILLSLYFRETFTGIISWILNLQFKNVEGAVAMFVLTYCQKEYQDVFLTRAEISDFVGYSRESIIHTLKKFEKEGLVSMDKKDIVILDEKSLKDIVKFG